MEENTKIPWIPMLWNPKVVGPYLIKLRYVNQTRNGKKVQIRYRIKRFYIHDTCHKGYFTKGDVSENATMLGWMPIPGHNY